ncbi:DUF2958 domain-containing protein [Muricauda sp. SCSIO 64092]|uniref:DUF2958 domain-containing protein n=1 Tax=Allomuricauda sp. SCSIO 64092 TaxID=2908842 RepID=UPI001FF39E11|nr:DUF2958 domain-containing protein [Muricauda sp. SCSIO 64092]UOY05022.1 DUF2958 domain-containing protein [Muricauda sp. SCSIO 64092]
MKLITEELKQRFAEVGDQSKDENPLVIAKFFYELTYTTWYATAYYPETNTCWGYVYAIDRKPGNLKPKFAEWVPFSIDELESLKGIPKIPDIERDLNFKEIRFNELRELLERERLKELEEFEQLKKILREQDDDLEY